jgi:hypothetical protein
MVSFSNNIENKIPLLNPTLKGFPGSLKHINREQTVIRVHACEHPPENDFFFSVPFHKIVCIRSHRKQKEPFPFTFYAKLRCTFVNLTK